MTSGTSRSMHDARLRSLRTIKVLALLVHLSACSGGVIEEAPGALDNSMDRDAEGTAALEGTSPAGGDTRLTRTHTQPPDDFSAMGLGGSEQESSVSTESLAGAPGVEQSPLSCAEICHAHFTGKTGLFEKHPGYVDDGVLVICGGPEFRIETYIEPCIDVCEAAQTEAAVFGCLAQFQSLWRCTFPNDECVEDCPEESLALAECKSASSD